MHVKNLPEFHTSGFEHKIILVNQKYSKYRKTVYPGNELFETALSASQNDGDSFILISSDTIPLKPFNEIYDAFSKQFDSHLCYSPTDQWLRFHSNAFVPKTHSWFIINKSDVKKIVIASKIAPANFFPLFQCQKQSHAAKRANPWPSASRSPGPAKLFATTLPGDT